MDKEIVIYSTPTCNFCQQARDFLDEKNIEYIDHNVAEDMERRKEMVEMTGQMGVPVIRVGEEAMVGFDRDKLAQLVGVEV